MANGMCRKHAAVVAGWWCQLCQGLWCDGCTSVVVGENARAICPQCGARLVALKDRGQRQPPRQQHDPSQRPQSAAARLLGSVVYPFKGQGPFLIGGWAVFMTVANIVSSLVMLVGFLIGGLMCGYMCAYALKIISSSAAGEESPPDWPDLANPWDDLLRPAMLLASAIVVCMLPAVVYAARGLSFGGDELVRFQGSAHILYLLGGTGLFFLPMTLLSVTMYDGAAGLNPLIILGSIVKVFPSYLIALVMLTVAVAARILVNNHVPHIPIVTTMFSEAMSLYFLLVEMRIIGVIYGANVKRLNWFDEATEGLPRGTAE